MTVRVQVSAHPSVCARAAVCDHGAGGLRRSLRRSRYRLMLSCIAGDCKQPRTASKSASRAARSLSTVPPRIACFVCARASCDTVSQFTTNSFSAAATTVPAGTTRSAKPMRSASSATIMAPVCARRYSVRRDSAHKTEGAGSRDGRSRSALRGFRHGPRTRSACLCMAHTNNIRQAVPEPERRRNADLCLVEAHAQRLALRV